MLSRGLARSEALPLLRRTFSKKTPFPLHSQTIEQHGDKGIDPLPDVAPAIRLTTTFQQGNPEGLNYSRDVAPSRKRLESLLGAVCGGHAVTYGSGLAAIAGLLNHTKPRTMLLDAGYHGTRLLINSFKEIRDVDVIEFGKEKKESRYDLVFLETPNNPYIEVKDVNVYSKIARKHGSLLAVDATLATPSGLDAFAMGVDIVMHSSTKYLGGHSDLLGGVLLCKDEERAKKLRSERTLWGAVMGNLETFLLLRSIRTLSVRVERQVQTAEIVAKWLHSHPQVKQVWHPALPSHPSHQLAKQQLKFMPATFSFATKTKEQAQKLGKKTFIFSEATSLGGVESLMDWRYQYDTTVDPALLRLSIGLEHADDLIADLDQALRSIA